MLKQMMVFDSSLLFLAKWYPMVYMDHIVFIHFSRWTQVVFISWLLWICRLADFTCFEYISSYRIAELYDSSIFHCFFFWGTSILFPVTTVILFITTVHSHGLIFFTSFRALVTFCLLVTPILTGVACYPTVVLYFSGNYPLYALVSLYVKWTYKEWYLCLLLWMLNVYIAYSKCPVNVDTMFVLCFPWGRDNNYTNFL